MGGGGNMLTRTLLLSSPATVAWDQIAIWAVR